MSFRKGILVALVGFVVPFLFEGLLLGVLIAKFDGNTGASKLTNLILEQGVWWGIAVGVGSSFMAVVLEAIPPPEQLGTKRSIARGLALLIIGPLLAFGIFLTFTQLIPEIKSHVHDGLRPNDLSAVEASLLISSGPAAAAFVSGLLSSPFLPRT